MDEKRPDNPDVNDDAYVIDDTDGSVEEIEREMHEAAKEAVEEPQPEGSDATEGDSGSGSLRDENAQLKDRLLRTLADFENLRKRTEREKADFFRYATSGVMKDVLPVLDNFERALEHAEEGDDFHKGVLMIYKQLQEVLSKHGLKVIDEAGVHFDPNIHEGVIREEDPSVPSHTVVAVLQKGYFIHDRLLRPAMVKVAVGGPERGVSS